MNYAVRIPVGERNALFQLNITDDDLVEGVEYQTLVLSAGNIVGIQNEENSVNTLEVATTLFIEDNDGKFPCDYEGLARKHFRTVEYNKSFFVTTQWLQLVFRLCFTLLLKGLWRYVLV